MIRGVIEQLIRDRDAAAPSTTSSTEMLMVALRGVLA